MHRLLYVSESHIGQSHVQSTVANIVAHSQVRNRQLGVTGALLFTGKHFAQILEGPPEAIHMLMTYICSDTRHGKILVVDKSPITRRRFADWQMAYHGPSQFVSRHVAKLLHPSSRSEQRRAVEWITDLAHEFSVPLKLPNYMKVVSTRPSPKVVQAPQHPELIDKILIGPSPDAHAIADAFAAELTAKNVEKAHERIWITGIPLRT